MTRTNWATRPKKPPVHHRASGARYTACAKDTQGADHEARCTTRRVKANCVGCRVVLVGRYERR